MNRGNGISEIEGKAAMGSGERGGSRASFKRKGIRIYLIGMLCGVMLATAFTYMFAIPANNDHWRMEIYKRGGGAWTMDMKNGRTGWKWMVAPIPDTPPKKPVTVPVYKVNAQTEQL
jgi:hypothetical protein